MWSKAARFVRQPPAPRGLLLEALLALFVARVVLLFIPFRRIAAWMGAVGAESAVVAPAEKEAAAAQVGHAVVTIARHVPWDSRCLAQALAGAWMLNRRGLCGTLYFGLKKDEQAPFAAHAWLRYGGRYVTGGNGHKTFRVIASFSRGVNTADESEGSE